MLRILFYIFVGCSILISCNQNDQQNNTIITSAEEKLRSIIKQYPDSIALRNQLVDYLAEKNEYESAIKESNIIIQKDSDNAAGWDTKGRLHFLNGDTAASISAFQSAIDITPDPKYLISLATLYAQTRNKIALDITDALLEAPRANATLQALYIKGLYYNYAGDKTNAISFFDKCLAIDHNFLDAYREKGVALYDLQKYEQAISLLKTATTIQKTFDEGWYWMGRCYQKLNKEKEAIESYRVALQLDPGYVEAKEALNSMGVKL